MPNIVRPPFKDASPGHEVKAISGNVLPKVSVIIDEKGEELTASGRSIPGLSMDRKWILGYKAELSNHCD